MKRRLTIARSLISEPDLLILDEPTTGLDPQARHLLWDRLYRLKQRGRDADHHHPLHGRGRAALRPPRGDGPRASIAAQGTPRELIDAHSTREVLELRFGLGEHEDVSPTLADLADRVEVLPDRLLLYTDDGDGALEQVLRRGLHPSSSLVRRSTLEDVFLRLTGRALVD